MIILSIIIIKICTHNRTAYWMVHRAVADGPVAPVLAGPTLPKASSDFGLNSGHSFIIVRLTTVFTVILVVWLLS